MQCSNWKWTFFEQEHLRPTMSDISLSQLGINLQRKKRHCSRWFLWVCFSNIPWRKETCAKSTEKRCKWQQEIALHCRWDTSPGQCEGGIFWCFLFKWLHAMLKTGYTHFLPNNSLKPSQNTGSSSQYYIMRPLFRLRWHVMLDSFFLSLQHVFFLSVKVQLLRRTPRTFAMETILHILKEMHWRTCGSDWCWGQTRGLPRCSQQGEFCHSRGH